MKRSLTCVYILCLSLLIIVPDLAAAKVPKKEAKVYEDIKVEKDPFNGVTEIATKDYISRQGFTDTFPVTILFRTAYVEDQRGDIQLYVQSNNVDWGYYHSAYGEDGTRFEFLEIGKETETLETTGMIICEEHYALTIPEEYLAKMAEKDWKIKVYGKKNEGVFIVPAQLSSAFLKKLKEYEASEE